jgi:hypothetical protein
MTCDDWIEQLDAWLDGELDPLRARAFEAHRASCEECRRVADDARSVQGWAATLPAELPPPTDHWPAIRQRIGTRTRNTPRVPLTWALAAAALLAVGSSALTASWVRPEVPVVAEHPDWETELRAATADLEAAVDARRSELDPETLRIVEQNLAIIDRAITETRDALATTPADPRAEEALVAAYNHKIRLLQQTLRVPAQG